MTGQTTDAVYKEAKRALDELADPSFQRHIIAELTEDEVRSWFDMTKKWRGGQST